MKITTLMTRFTFFLILNFISLISFSQIVKLGVNNPAPRIGENIPITYNIKWTDNKVKYPISPDEIKDINRNKLGKGTLTLEEYTIDTGSIVIGPFTFEIDGQIFKSDTLILNVYPKLPNEKNGFWTRLIKYNGEYYFITEQRIGGEWKHKKDSKNSYSMTFDSQGVDFAEIPRSTIKFDNIEINFSYSSSNTQTIEGEDVFGEGTVHYKLYVYRIEITDNYKNDFVIKKKHFENFPKGIDFEPVRIIVN